MTTLLLRGFFALILTVAGSIWIGQLIAKSSARSGGAAQHLEAIEQLNLIERRLLDGRGPLKRRVRRLKATTPTPFQICPARRGRRIQSYPEHGVEVVTFGKGKGIFLRRQASGLAQLEGQRRRAKAVCLPLPGHKRRRFVISIAFGLLGMLIGLAMLLLPLVRRLRATESVVRRLADGDYQARVRDGGGDAVGQLADGVDRIGQRVEELLAAQRHLHASVSHELRTPLARLAAAIDLAEDHPNEKLFVGMRADVDELDGMVNELLTLARLQDPHARRAHDQVDLAALTAQRVEAAQRGATSELQWTLTLPPAAPCFGDRRLLARLLDNLINNAMRHATGRVEVELRGDKESWRLTVSDDGEGIAADEAEHLFTPFVSGEHGGSAGLGLAICREIADRHDAALRVRRSELGGAQFELLMPA